MLSNRYLCCTLNYEYWLSLFFSAQTVYCKQLLLGVPAWSHIVCSLTESVDQCIYVSCILDHSDYIMCVGGCGKDNRWWVQYFREFLSVIFEIMQALYIQCIVVSRVPLVGQCLMASCPTVTVPVQASLDLNYTS